MTQFGKNILVSSALASSDFVSFIISMYIAIGGDAANLLI